MPYAYNTDTTEFLAAAIEDGALFDIADLEDILVHLETNADALIAMARDTVTH